MQIDLEPSEWTANGEEPPPRDPFIEWIKAFAPVLFIVVMAALVRR
jgi:hypothetical protein